MIERFYVVIREQQSPHVEVSRVGASLSRRTAERVEDGANRNLNHTKYYTEIVSEPESAAPTKSAVEGPEHTENSQPSAA